MSYAVVRMQKMKLHDLKGIQFHNQRERESNTNSDIDKSKSHLNYDLVNEQKIDYNKRVKAIIDSQKTSERKIRKDAVLVNELLITSDSDFFKDMSLDEQKRFFKESLEVFEERYGKQNIAYATVHLDEKTPHLHVGVVPMRDGKLQSKNVFNRQELLWLQEEFPKKMQSLGFNLKRGERGSDREHIETAKFKRMTLEKEVNQLLEKKEQLLEVVPEEPIEVPILKKETEKIKIGLLKSEERETGNVVLSKEQYDSLTEQVNAAAMIKKDYEKLKNTDLYQENKSLKDSLEIVSNEYKNTYKGFMRLEAENKQLKAENEQLKHTVNDLREEIRAIYTSTKVFLREITNNNIKLFKNYLSTIVSKVKERKNGTYLQRVFDNEQRKERELGR